MPTRVWLDHKTPVGRTYYYNKVTKQSVWEMPKDFELVMPLPLSFSTPPTTPGNEKKTGMLCSCGTFYIIPGTSFKSPLSLNSICNVNGFCVIDPPSQQSSEGQDVGMASSSRGPIGGEAASKKVRAAS